VIEPPEVSTPCHVAIEGGLLPPLLVARSPLLNEIENVGDGTAEPAAQECSRSAGMDMATTFDRKPNPPGQAAAEC